MIQQFFIACRLPSLNEIIAAAKVRQGGWSRYLEMKAAYQALCKDDIRQAKLKPMGRVAVQFLWHEPNQRRDPDGVCVGAKFVLDALVERKILPNDGWQNIAELAHAWIVATPVGVLVTLRETD